jgi:hypothetical protein
MAAHSGRFGAISQRAPLIGVRKGFSAITYPKQDNKMRASRLRVSMLVVAVWAATVATAGPVRESTVKLLKELMKVP